MSRSPEVAPRLLRFAEYRFDTYRHLLWRGEEPIVLQRKRAEALALLLRNAGDLVTRDQLIDHLWGDTIVEYDKSLNPIVRNLREALGDSATRPRFIETIRGEGYRFLVPVEVDREAEAEPEDGVDPSQDGGSGRWLRLRRGVFGGLALFLETLVERGAAITDKLLG